MTLFKLLIISVSFSLLLSCSLMDYTWNVSSSDEFKGKIGIKNILSERMNIWQRERGSSEIQFSSNSLEKYGNEDSLPKIVVRKGSKIIIDKIMKSCSGGYTSYYSVGRVFQDGKEIEFEYYMGEKGYTKELRFPPVFKTN